MKFYQDRRFILPIAFFVGLELFFQLGAYKPFLKVNSYAANVNRITDYVIKKQEQLDPQILVLGTSVAYQGLSVPILNSYIKNKDYKLQSIAIPGSELIVQHYATQKVLQKMKKVKLLIHVFEITMPWVQKKNIMLPTLAMVSELNRFAALGDLTRFGYTPTKEDYLYLTLKTVGYRRDIKDLILDPGNRIKKLGRKWREVSDTVYEYENQETMKISSYYPIQNLDDCVNRANPAAGIPIPEDSNRHHKKALWETCALARVTTTETGLNESVQLYFKRLKILYDAVKAKNIRIINVFAPYSNLMNNLGGKERMQVWRQQLQKLNGEKTVIIDLQHVIDGEKNPDYCYDLIHLNTYGMKLFSQQLGQILQQRIDEFIPPKGGNL